MNATNFQDTKAEEEIIDLAVQERLGRTMRPINGIGPRVFVTDSGYATEALLSFAAAITRRGAGLAWRPIAEAPEDEPVLIFTTGGHRGTAFFTNEDPMGEGKKWFWDGSSPPTPIHPNLKPIGFMPIPAAPPCETCNGNGMIGGPSYREPDEGGVPCPDCNSAGAAQGEVN